MRDNDTLLMEEVYNNIIINELNLKTGAAVAGMLGSALFPSNIKADEVNSMKYPDSDRAAIDSMVNPELDATASVDKIVDLLNNNKSIGDIINTDPKILNSLAEEVKKEKIDQAKRLVYNLQIRNQKIPDFLLRFKQDFSSGKSGG